MCRENVGHWVLKQKKDERGIHFYGFWTCSACGKEALMKQDKNLVGIVPKEKTYISFKSDYCPSCGAFMNN